MYEPLRFTCHGTGLSERKGYSHMMNVRAIRSALVTLVAAAACAGGLVFSSVQPAQMDTYSGLISTQNQRAVPTQCEAELK